MRSTTKGYKPQLETLEERWVPATVKNTFGDLFISNQNGPLTVTVSTTTAGQVTVKDNGSPVTYSGVGSLIEITGTNLPDSITFNGFTANYAGNLLVLSGNGTDIVNLNGGGTGNFITNGSVLVDSTIDNNDQLNLNGNIGGSLTYFSQYGFDNVVTTGATTVSGNASLTGLQNLTLTSAFTVKGSLNLTNISAGFPLDVTGAGALSVGTSANVFQSLTVSGGANADKFIPTGVVSVTGNATFSFTQSVGHSALSLAGGSSVGGNLSYYGGNGGDTVTLAALDTVAGNATLILGNGANTLNLNSAWEVAGNLTISEGNGANGAFTIGGTVAGDETVTQGNGVNGTVELTGPSSGVFTYHGGNGTDSVDLQGPAGEVYDVYITFGTGTNTLAFDTTNTGLTYLGYVSGSGGTNTFTQGALDTLIDITFNNFP